MKKHISLYMIATLLVLLMNSSAFAMNGNGNGNGNRDGSGPLLLHTVISTFTYDGEIVSAGLSGDGIELATVDGLVVLYGLAPTFYWDSLGLDKLESLAVGASISVTGIVVDYNGELRNLVTSITVDGTTLDLRDPTTGTPLWRQSFGQKPYRTCY